MAAVPFGLACWTGYTSARWAMVRGWPAVPCLILSSRVDQNWRNDRYVVHVTYRYLWEGREYVGRMLRQDYSGSWDLAAADRLMRSFPAGAARVCYVNPRSASEAVLEREQLIAPIGAAALMLLFGAVSIVLFVSPGLLWHAAGPFLIVLGTFGFISWFCIPLSQGLSSRGWQPRPCIVLAGEVRSRYQASWPVSYTVYWPDIVFRYEVDGVTYRSNLYQATYLGTAWFYGPRRIVRSFPPGLRTTCFVNPTDPNEAVLDIGFSGTLWFGLALLPVALIATVDTCRSVLRGKLRLGSPGLWGWLALGTVAAFSLLIFQAMGTDLVHDHYAGRADWPEYAGVAVAGSVTILVLLAWFGLAIDHAKGGPGQVAASKIEKKAGLRDGEIDG
jgi:hypothetical protein